MMGGGGSWDLEGTWRLSCGASSSSSSFSSSCFDHFLRSWSYQWHRCSWRLPPAMQVYATLAPWASSHIPKLHSMQSKQRSMPHNASTGAHVITGEDRSNSIWNNNNNLLFHPSSIIDVSHQTSSPNFQYPGASPHPPLHLSGSLEARGLFNEFLSKLICPCYVCMMGEHGD